MITEQHGPQDVQAAGGQPQAAAEAAQRALAPALAELARTVVSVAAAVYRTSPAEALHWLAASGYAMAPGDAESLIQRLGLVEQDAPRMVPWRNRGSVAGHADDIYRRDPMHDPRVMATMRGSNLADQAQRMATANQVADEYAERDRPRPAPPAQPQFRQTSHAAPPSQGF